MFTKTFFSILTCCAFALLLANCEKDNLTDIKNTVNTAEHPGIGLVSSCGESLKAGTVLGLMADTEDAHNHRINQIIYHYGQAFKNIVQSPTYRCYLETALISDQEGVGVSIMQLAANNPEFALVLNAALRQSIVENNIYPKGVENGVEMLILNQNWNANAYLKSKMIYPPFNYDPIIYSVKHLETCESAKLPVVLLAQEVDECDDVPGWYGNTEILMSEDQVAASSDPIIFIGPRREISAGFLAGTDAETTANNEDALTAGDRVNVDVDVDLHQIKNGYRYETNSRSEISAIEIYYAGNNMTPSGIFWGYWADFTKNDRKIHKDDIASSHIFGDDKNAFTIPGSIFDTEVSVVHLFAYEHDWYASNKCTDASGECLSPSGLQFKCRRKYEHEYYFMTCGYGSSMFKQSGSLFNVENEKCRFQLKRTN